LGIAANDKLPGLRSLTETIHQAGAKAIAHLNHPRRMANKIPVIARISADEMIPQGIKLPEMVAKTP